MTRGLIDGVISAVAAVLGVTCFAGCGDSDYSARNVDIRTEPAIIEGYRTVTSQPDNVELIYERSHFDRVIDTVVTERAREVTVSVLLKALEGDEVRYGVQKHGVAEVKLSKPLGARRVVTKDGTVVRRWEPD